MKRGSKDIHYMFFFPGISLELEHAQSGCCWNPSSVARRTLGKWFEDFRLLEMQWDRQSSLVQPCIGSAEKESGGAGAKMLSYNQDSYCLSIAGS